MLLFPEDAYIYFYATPVDLRKGCEGLATVSSLVTTELDDTYFVFLNRKRNRIKILYQSSSNVFYWFVRSRQGVFAPKKTRTSMICVEEMQMILSGSFPERLKVVSE